jgi:hypothetical protein
MQRSRCSKTLVSLKCILEGNEEEETFGILQHLTEGATLQNNQAGPVQNAWWHYTPAFNSQEN